MAAAGFLCRYLNGPLPYASCHITVDKNVLSVSLYRTFPSFFDCRSLIPLAYTCALAKEVGGMCVSPTF